MPHDKIINLSFVNLLPEHISLLLKGLKFVPTPAGLDAGILWDDLSKFHNKLRRTCYFNDPANNNSSNSQSSAPVTVLTAQAPPEYLGTPFAFQHRDFKLPSTWVCPPQAAGLERMIVLNEEAFLHRPPEFVQARHNLTPDERWALKDLARNNNIVIRPADKGAAVVLWPRAAYLTEGYRQLSNQGFYHYLDHNPTQAFKWQIHQFVTDMLDKGEIDITVHTYLLHKTNRTPELYLLPKIHKGITPVPGRPIVSGNGSPTEKISKFVDFFINPLCHLLPSYLKDTTHLLQILHNLHPLPEGTLLVTLDVCSLYTNIPTTEGIKAVSNALYKHRTSRRLKPSNASLLGLLKLVLTKNNFVFNGNNYLQVQGTAMGTRLAPSFANLYMGHFEDEFVYPYNPAPSLFLRYIDDIFLIWEHGPTSLQRFIDHINSCVPSIQFTSTISVHQVSFLDTWIRLADGRISTDLYVKPTDAHNYLRFNSAHPLSCKASIPYSQFLRIRRICSSTKDYISHVIHLADHFYELGYPTSLITEQAFKVLHLDRTDLLGLTATTPTPNASAAPPVNTTRRRTANSNTNATASGAPAPPTSTPAASTPPKVILTTTYHPHHSSVTDFVRNNWSVLAAHQSTLFLSRHKLICGFRRAPNLRNLLTKAKVPRLIGDDFLDPHRPRIQGPPQPDPTPVLHHTAHRLVRDTLGNPRGDNLCNRRPGTCHYCPQLNKTGRITSTYTRRTWPCCRNVSCNSSNIVYCITCKLCKKQYVGQTHQRLKDRMGKHLSNIKDINSDTAVARHFNERGHTGRNNPATLHEDLELTVLSFIPTPPRALCSVYHRYRVEKYWYHTLRTRATIGLNMETPKPHFL